MGFQHVFFKGTKGIILSLVFFVSFIFLIGCSSKKTNTDSELSLIKTNELRIDYIGNLTNKKVKYYRAPGFSVKESNKWIFDELIKQNIEIDCSIFPAKRAHGGFAAFPTNNPSIISAEHGLIKELPINTFQILKNPIIFSGGGYFRLLPYPIIKNLVSKSDYVMTYFHPRDFDPNQPIIKDLSFYRKFKSYVGLNNAFVKLEKLISDFEFIDIAEATKEISWDSVKVVSI